METFSDLPRAERIELAPGYNVSRVINGCWQLSDGHALDAPIAVVGSRNGITPGPELESFFFPQVSWILDAIHERILPLPGHVPTTKHATEAEIARLNREGL